MLATTNGSDAPFGWRDYANELNFPVTGGFNAGIYTQHGVNWLPVGATFQ